MMLNAFSVAKYAAIGTEAQIDSLHGLPKDFFKRLIVASVRKDHPRVRALEHMVESLTSIPGLVSLDAEFAVSVHGARCSTQVVQDPIRLVRMVNQTVG
jgi:hypothetical protein